MATSSADPTAVLLALLVGIAVGAAAAYLYALWLAHGKRR